MDTTITRLLSTLVSALRLRFALPVFGLLVAFYLGLLHPWLMTWGSTATEQQMALPGDELVPNPAAQSTRAITINAPPEVVWQWLMQIGQDRAGFYSYDWLENLFGSDIHNGNEIRPEWQQRATGERVPLVPPGFLGSPPDFGPTAITDPGRSLILTGWGTFVLQPVDSHTTRLIVRDRSPSASLFNRLVTDPVYGVMEKQMLRGIKARAEGRPDTPLGLRVAATIGWLGTAATVAVLFLTRRRRWPWLVLPIGAALPALLTSSDLWAALAGFIAVGITLLGVLAFGRRWWGFFLLLGSAVMLTLLLVADAWVAFGLAFALFLVATLAALVLNWYQDQVMVKRRRLALS
jgi:hypothetical protein